MRVSLRAAFTVLLWLAALAPLALYVVHLRSPVAAVEVSQLAKRIAAEAALWLALGLVATVLLYPPFVPSVRVAMQRMRRRLGVERTAMLESLARLKHFENLHDHVVVGRSALAQGQLPLALQHLGRAAELDPSDVPARFQLGLVLVAMKRWTEAAQVLAFVIDRDLDHAYGEALLRFGEALLRAGDTKTARAVLERRVERHGKSREALVLLALAQSRLGDTAAAQASYRAAAAPPAAGERKSAEDALWRARARVALWRGGKLA